jgi:hypothetical protein
MESVSHGLRKENRWGGVPSFIKEHKSANLSLKNLLHFCMEDSISWEFRDSSHGVAYRGGSTVVTMGPARDYANGDTSVYPGLGPSRVEVTPLLPACFVLTRQ